jgi:hypothetical protein
VAEVSGGFVTFDQGDLVYGVTYSATVFNTDGEQFQAFQFTAGFSDSQNVTLARLAEQELVIVADSRSVENLHENGEIVLTFNREIELSPRFSQDSVEEAFDDGFSFVSPDADGDDEFNIPTTEDEDDAQERGARFIVDGNQLTLRWQRNGSNFEEQDNGDPIQSVTYTLGAILLRPAGGRAEEERSLSELVGADTATIFVDTIDL